jgi:acetyl esterase/lipase
MTRRMWLALAAAGLHAQDSHEALGAKDQPGVHTPSPLLPLTRSLHSALKPELRGIHPRVFLTPRDIEALRRRARTTHAAMWREAMAYLRILDGPPPPPPAQARRAQNQVAYAIAGAALAYRIDGKPEYLAGARKYMDAAVSYDVWGYTFSKPNVDLAAGHLLYGLSFGYDLLYHDLSEADRARYRAALVRHGELLTAAFWPKPGRTYAYSQNHTFIPIAGLAVAAYALYDEAPEARRWAALARAIYDRVLATYSQDGYYYEGFEYWVFATPWIIHYLDALRHATGEDLFDHPGLRNMKYYAAHILAPGGQDIFDFGDVFEGPLTREHKGEEYARSHPRGRLHSNYNILYRLASQFRDPETQGVAHWMRELGHVNMEEYWSLLWFDPSVEAAPIARLAPWHRFEDHDVVFWRNNWTGNANAIAFKCGPPEGHHTAELLEKLPDWRLSSGHSHPDNNSFIWFAGETCLTGDSGYAGVPKTADHNTLLVDGHGQGSERGQHNAWAGFPYDRLNTVRIESFQPSATGFEARGEASGAYAASLGLNKFERHIVYKGAAVVVTDTVSSDAPHEYTTMYHADASVERHGNDFELIGEGRQTLLAVESPHGARTEIEKNLVIGPGRPGSVDQGPTEQRGERVAISTPGPVRDATFDVVLRPGKSTVVIPVEFRDITYAHHSGEDQQLDVFRQPGEQAAPVLVYFHGGGWWRNRRPASYRGFQRFLDMGFSIVNADYRLSSLAPAPAGVEDARCVLGWVRRHAAKYHFDLDRIVVWGTSSGGHLALMDGLLPEDSGIDLAGCGPFPRVAAVLDFYGIADVSELLSGPHMRHWAQEFVGNGPGAAELARRMSPIEWVRKGDPPVLIVHGDADPTVPYQQSVGLAKALAVAGNRVKLYTVPGGHHGRFNEQQMEGVWAAVREFLGAVGVV